MTKFGNGKVRVDFASCSDSKGCHLNTEQVTLIIISYFSEERMTPAQAARHPFLASVCGFRHLTEDMTDNYNPITLNRNTYKSSPAIAHEVLQKHLSPKALLREGTKNHLISRKRGDDASMKQVAEVVPVKRACKGGKNGYEPVASGSGYDEADGIPGITVQRTLTDIMNLIHEEEDRIEDKLEMSPSAGQRDSKVSDSPTFQHQCKVPVRVLENKIRKSPELPFVDRLMAMRMQRQRQSIKHSRNRRLHDTGGELFSAGGSSDWTDMTDGSVVDSTASGRINYSDSGRPARDHQESASKDRNNRNRKRCQSVGDVIVNSGASERDSESHEVIEIKSEPVDPVEIQDKNEQENHDQDDDYRLPTLFLSPSARPLRPAKKNKFSETSRHTIEPDLTQTKTRDRNDQDRNNQFDSRDQRTLSKQNVLDSERTCSSYHGAKNSGTGKNCGRVDRNENDDFDPRRTSSKFLHNENSAFQRTKNSSRDRRQINSPTVEDKEMLIPKKGVLDKLVSNLKKSQTVGKNSDEFQTENGTPSYSSLSQGNCNRASELDRRTDYRNVNSNFSHDRKERVLQTASGIRFRENSADRAQRQCSDAQTKHRPRHKSVSDLPSEQTVPEKRATLGPELAQSPTEKKEWYDFIDTPEDKRKHLFLRHQTPNLPSKQTTEESPGLNLLSPVNFNDRRDDTSSKGKKRTREQFEDDQYQNHGNKITKTARRELMSVLDKPGSPRRKEVEMLYPNIPDHARARGKNQSLCMSSGESRISCSSVSPSSRKNYATTKKEAIFQEAFSANKLDTEDEFMPSRAQNHEKRLVRSDQGASLQSSGIRRRQSSPDRMRNQGLQSVDEDDRVSNHSNQMACDRDDRSKSRNQLLPPSFNREGRARSSHSQSPAFRESKPSPQRPSNPKVEERVEGHFGNRRTNRHSVSPHGPPKSSESAGDQFDNRRPQTQQNRQQFTQKNQRGNVSQASKFLSPLTEDGYKFDSDSENEEVRSSHDRRSPARTNKLSVGKSSQDHSPGRYHDIVSGQDSDDCHSNTGSNMSKSFRSPPKQVSRPTSRCASPVEEWHSPRHFSQPSIKKTVPVYSTGQRQPVNSNSNSNRVQNSNVQSRGQSGVNSNKRGSGSFLDSPVTSDEEGAFNGKPMVDTSIRGKSVSAGLAKDIVSGLEDGGGHWVTPNLEQRGIHLQPQQRIVYKKTLQQNPGTGKSVSNVQSQNRSKACDINQNYKIPFSRDSSSESQGRKSLSNSVVQRNSSSRKASPIPSTSHDYLDRNQSEGNRARTATRKTTRNPLHSDSSPSPSPGRTRSDSRVLEEEVIEDAVSATGRPRRKCVKKKVTFDASDDSLGSVDESHDPNYDAGDNDSDDDFSPEEKKVSR
jgi:hypothetical protein